MMSGGVDSSVAAYLLTQNENYEVRGVFMKCWSLDKLRQLGFSDQLYNCTWQDDMTDASIVAGKLGIPFEVWDFQDEYANGVVEYMIGEYLLGRTPNPDVMCNSIVKFGVFYERAMALGADFVATGHYAKIDTIPLTDSSVSNYIIFGNNRFIIQANDDFKDQSYFLWKIDKERLQKALMPIGDIENKAKVREIALENGLITAHKKDSQGLCFVGKTSLRGMLLERFGSKTGTIVTTQMDRVSGVKQITNKVKKEYQENGYVTLGTHEGACIYTIGQREGLGIGGGPWYVSAIDALCNIVYVKHASSIADIDEMSCTISGINSFVGEDELLEVIASGVTLKAQIRYNQGPVECRVVKEGGDFKVFFKTPIRAIAKGQSCVVYMYNDNIQGAILLGGIIV